MPITNSKNYPVVDPDPSFGKTIYNFNLTDYLTIGAFGTAGYVYGWFAANKRFKSFNARTLLGIGLFAGTCFAMQTSTYRLIGINPNEREIQLYGVISDEALAEYNERELVPNIELIKSPKFER